VFDGYSGYGVFRPHAYRYWFLHDEVQLMLSAEELGPKVIEAIQACRAPVVVLDQWSETLPRRSIATSRRITGPRGSGIFKCANPPPTAQQEVNDDRHRCPEDEGDAGLPRTEDRTLLFVVPPSMTVLDVGVASEAAEGMPARNYFLKTFRYAPPCYTGLGIDDLDGMDACSPGNGSSDTRAEGFPFSDREFDWVFSNAVIEHVGDDRAQLAFLNEMVRVAKHVFFTTPNQFFPIELHTGALLLHWSGTASSPGTSAASRGSTCGTCGCFPAGACADCWTPPMPGTTRSAATGSSD